MQYHLLQAQINPHFMYNTLFSIKCVVDMNENRRASQMLSAFIQLLRSSLTDPDSMTTLRQQMDAAAPVCRPAEIPLRRPVRDRHRVRG